MAGNTQIHVPDLMFAERVPSPDDDPRYVHVVRVRSTILVHGPQLRSVKNGEARFVVVCDPLLIETLKNNQGGTRLIDRIRMPEWLRIVVERWAERVHATTRPGQFAKTIDFGFMTEEVAEMMTAGGE